MLYFFIIFLFFIPISAFADTSENCLLLTNISNDKKLDEIKSQSLDFSNCNLIGINLNELLIAQVILFNS